MDGPLSICVVLWDGLIFKISKFNLINEIILLEFDIELVLFCIC